MGPEDRIITLSRGEKIVVGEGKNKTKTAPHHHHHTHIHTKLETWFKYEEQAKIEMIVKSKGDKDR